MGRARREAAHEAVQCVLAPRRALQADEEYAERANAGRELCSRYAVEPEREPGRGIHVRGALASPVASTASARPRMERAFDRRVAAVRT